jgi:hypothetical protein
LYKGYIINRVLYYRTGSILANKFCQNGSEEYPSKLDGQLYSVGDSVWYLDKSILCIR